MSSKPAKQLDTALPRGKSKTALNALKHGVFSQAWVDPNEQQQFDELSKSLQEEYTTTSRIAPRPRSAEGTAKDTDNNSF